MISSPMGAVGAVRPFALGKNTLAVVSVVTVAVIAVVHEIFFAPKSLMAKFADN